MLLHCSDNAHSVVAGGGTAPCWASEYVSVRDVSCFLCVTYPLQFDINPVSGKASSFLSSLSLESRSVFSWQLECSSSILSWEQQIMFWMEINSHTLTHSWLPLNQFITSIQTMNHRLVIHHQWLIFQISVEPFATNTLNLFYSPEKCGYKDGKSREVVSNASFSFWAPSAKPRARSVWMVFVFPVYGGDLLFVMNGWMWV